MAKGSPFMRATCVILKVLAKTITYIMGKKFAESDHPDGIPNREISPNLVTLATSQKN
jgi:hypothetical protein